jgi:hypothetical protein
VHCIALQLFFFYLDFYLLSPSRRPDDCHWHRWVASNSVTLSDSLHFVAAGPDVFEAAHRRNHGSQPVIDRLEAFARHHRRSHSPMDGDTDGR